MGYAKTILIILFSSFTLNAHATQSVTSTQGQSLEQLYLNNIKNQSSVMNGIKEGIPIGDSRDYLPIIDPPIVKKVWIPAIEGENDNQVLVSGHWVYVMLKESSWKR